MVRRHIFFYGRVQGVGFRWHSVSKARLLGLTGWVRNLPDGSVEMEVQGTSGRIGELLGYLYEQKYIRIEDIKADVTDSGVRVKAEYDMENVGAVLKMSYLLNASGEIAVTQHMIPGKDKDINTLLRYGMSMAMPHRFSKVDYYGHGPHENYIDRSRSAMIGVYSADVADLYQYDYVRPQESGARTGLRYWRVVDRVGNGLEISASVPFTATSLNYKIEDLDLLSPTYVRHPSELVPREDTYVSIDLRQLGIGCVNSWGALPLEEYMMPYGEYIFEFIIKIL